LPSAASKRTTRPTEMFSFSDTLMSSTASDLDATASSPLSATNWASSSARLTNSGDLATKSVSLRSSTRAATLPERARATAPSELSRSERFTELARPRSRSSCAACSKSPAVSSSAFLASIIPAPVDWRRRCTSLAVNSAICLLLLFHFCWCGLGCGRFGRRGLGCGRRLGLLLREARLALLRLQGGLAASLGLLGCLGLLLLGSERRRAGRLRAARRGAARRHEPAFVDGVGDDPAHQAAGADGVVVARDHVLDEIGVAVGVDHGHDRQGQLVGLGDGDVLLLGVDDEHRIGEARHTADAAEVALQLLELTAEDERLLLGHGLEVARVLHALVLLHLLHPVADGGEVGEHAAEPPLVDVRHAALLGVGGDGVLRLLLGADEEHRAVVGDEVADEAVGHLDALQRLAQVDDVDPVALSEDEPLHLGVPAPSLVAEMDAGLQQVLHGDDSHELLLPIGWS